MDLINCNCCSNSSRNSSCSGEAVPEATRAFIATDKPVLSTARHSAVASMSVKPMPFPDEVRAKIK